MSSGGVTTNMTQQQQSQVTAVQSNGGTKKGISGGNSSGGPTPAATPVQNGTGQGPSPPPSTNAPKYGTLVPNRIFVGGIAANTTETELMQLFSEFGAVRAAKIIQDRAGVSKGYGFITFETEDDARRPLRNPDNIMLRERRLNIAPAIKKQPFGRPSAAPPYDSQITADGRSPAPPPHQTTLQPQMPIFFGSPPQFYAGATAYYAPPVPSMVSSTQAQVQVSQASQDQPNQQAAVYQAPPVYPTQTGPHQTAPYPSMMFPQAIYMPQQYPMVPYEYSYGVAPGAPPTNGMPPHFAAAGTPPGGGASPPRGPCYAPAPAPPETILYGHPPHHIFHPSALDPTGAGGPMYASADGTFDPMGPHPSMASFGPMGVPFGLNEDGTFLDRPSTSATPRSVLTATPPAEQRSAVTPVVSVLGLDQQQEKDPAAMQGGRRPPAPQPQQNAQRRGPASTGNRRPYGRPPNMQHFQPPQPTSFIPTARRSRKPQRRGTTVHGTPNEIGAGDAPLPNQDDGLAAQVEALKI